MGKKIISIACLALSFLNSNAQKRNNSLSITREASVPIYQNDQGFGISVKGLHRIGSFAQLKLSGGVSIFRTTNKIAHGDIITRLIPFLIGYKQNINHFFIEPQMGLGELGGRIKLEGDYARPSVAAVFGAIGAGYRFKQFNVGIRFQTALGIEGSSAGLWHDRNFHYTGIFVAYDFVSRRVRKQVCFFSREDAKEQRRKVNVGFPAKTLSQ